MKTQPRRRIDDWRLLPDPENTGRQDAWYQAVPPEAQPAPVPGIIQQVFPGYHGVAWYWASFPLAALPAAHERVLLRFGAVDYLAEVWVNGLPVGGHEGGETPFELDATAAVHAGENRLAVRVLNPDSAPIDGFTLVEIPHRNKSAETQFQPGMGYNYGGILLPVELAVVPALRVADIFARPDLATGEIAVTVTVRNDQEASPGTLRLSAGPALTGEAEAEAELGATFPPGDSTHEFRLPLAQPRLWDLDDPFLYGVEAALETKAGRHQRTVRCGFREFRVTDGWFTLNGKRLFVKSTHTGNHFPLTQVAPTTADFATRDLLYAKALGFNMVRFISGMAWPEQLDYCDEIGLLVYEEHLAGWCLDNSHAGEDRERVSPHMAEWYDFSTREMILRDRNHPSVALWGLLNETQDGPVFRQAVAALQLVRDLDPTRLVLLASGRWDGQPGIGSVSNPGSRAWEHVWGVEEPTDQAPRPWGDLPRSGHRDQAGDAHVYTAGPIPREAQAFLRALGAGTKPVFLSEAGMGSLFNVVDEGRAFRPYGAREDLPDLAYIEGMRARLEKDWRRWKLAEAYPFLEDMLRDSYRQSGRQRRKLFDLIRSNPQLCGYNLTGMLDHALTGEGVWTFWREFKPGIADVMRDGWAPLRWCLFASPEHGYSGDPLHLEAVLANEEVLPPGDYPVTFRLWGPAGQVWEKRAVATVTADRPFATPVLSATVRLKGPAGEYTFAASMEAAAPRDDRLTVRVSSREALPHLDVSVMTWGLTAKAQRWLADHGATCRPFAPEGEGVLLVGVPREKWPEAQWRAVAEFAERGGTVVCLAPRAFAEGDDPVRWLPLRGRLTCVTFWDWLYHREHVARPHPVLAGLQGPGVLDWDYYGEVISHEMFQGSAQPVEPIVAAFAVGYCRPTGYESGIVLGAYPYGRGRLVLNALHLLENLGRHPAADRLTLNLIAWAAGA